MNATLRPLQILHGVNLRTREDGIAADRIIDRHHDLELPTARIRGDHLIVGHRGRIDLAALHGACHHRIIAEGDELDIESVPLVIAVGRRAIDRTVADPGHDAQGDRRARMSEWRDASARLATVRPSRAGAFASLRMTCPLCIRVSAAYFHRFDTGRNKKVPDMRRIRVARERCGVRSVKHGYRAS